MSKHFIIIILLILPLFSCGEDEISQCEGYAYVFCLKLYDCEIDPDYLMSELEREYEMDV